MSQNLYYFIFLFGSIIASSIFIVIYKIRARALNNPAFIAPIILEAIDEAVIITNASGIIIFINQAGKNLLKTAQKEILGENISKIFADNRIELTPEIKEIYIRAGNDEIISVSISINKITDNARKFVGYSIMLEKNDAQKNYLARIQKKTNELSEIDNLLEQIRQNKKNEERNIEEKILESTLDIREEHARLYASIDNLNLGFIMVDQEKNIIMINNTAENLFSIPNPKTNINLQNLQINTQEKIDLPKNVEYVLKNGNRLSFENISINDKYANIFISPINTFSKISGAAILTEDKTQEWTAEKSKEDFFTIASHELRTPLTAIRGYIAIIKQFFFTSINEEELKKIITDIDTLSARLIKIVNDFLDTPKLEQGKIRVKKEPCDLISIIQACIKETNSLAVPKNLFIKFTNPFNTAAVLGDNERIRQILINLISNGLKYTEQGGITINIEKTPDARYKISVKDTGKGVPKENIKTIFNKFQRTDPTKHMTSTGLGLYISKLLVEKMDGSINLENTEEGKGSTFSFSLPINREKPVYLIKQLE